MKRTTTIIRILLFITSLFAVAMLVVVKATTITIFSNAASWTVKDAGGNFLGHAQNVCLNGVAPRNCSPTATKYGYPGQDWTADLSSIPGATWIWAPNITGASAGAGNADFFFESMFFLCGTPVDGTISLAADDFAEVFLNGGTTPVVTSRDWSKLTTVTVPASNFHQGPNNIQIHAKNGANPQSCISGQYDCNPAGVVLGASFADALSTWPTCADKGKVFQVGDQESLSCPAGQTGSPVQVCACAGSTSFWLGPIGSCVTSPTTCTGTNGTIYQIGDKEPLTCPVGTNGSAFHTCQANGMWASIDTSGCQALPKTCTGTNGSTFAVGSSETLACPASQVGSLSHSCRPDGTWGPTSGTCHSPTIRFRTTDGRYLSAINGGGAGLAAVSVSNPSTSETFLPVAPVTLPLTSGTGVSFDVTNSSGGSSGQWIRTEASVVSRGGLVSYRFGGPGAGVWVKACCVSDPGYRGNSGEWTFTIAKTGGGAISTGDTVTLATVDNFLLQVAGTQSGALVEADGSTAGPLSKFIVEYVK